MSKSRSQIVRSWLSHPGARIVKQAFRRAAINAAKEYDQAKTEREMIFIQVKRQVLTETIPQMLDQLTFDLESKENKRFNWRRIFGIKER